MGVVAGVGLVATITGGVTGFGSGFTCNVSGLAIAFGAAAGDTGFGSGFTATGAGAVSVGLGGALATTVSTGFGLAFVTTGVVSGLVATIGFGIVFATNGVDTDGATGNGIVLAATGTAADGATGLGLAATGAAAGGLAFATTGGVEVIGAADVVVGDGDGFAVVALSSGVGEFEGEGLGVEVAEASCFPTARSVFRRLISSACGSFKLTFLSFPSAFTTLVAPPPPDAADRNRYAGNPNSTVTAIIAKRTFGKERLWTGKASLLCSGISVNSASCVSSWSGINSPSTACF